MSWSNKKINASVGDLLSLFFCQEEEERWHLQVASGIRIRLGTAIKYIQRKDQDGPHCHKLLSKDIHTNTSY